MAKNTIKTEETKQDQKQVYVLPDMKGLIIGAYSTGNKGAISKEDAAKAGVTEQTWSQWVAYCNALQATIIELNKLTEDPKATKKALDVAQSAVFTEWRKVLKDGLEKDFDPHFFIRATDVFRLFGYNDRFVSTAYGKQFGNKRAVDFRRLVETFIGARIAGNGVMSADDADIVESYDSAVRNKESAEKLLNGYVRNDTAVEGLRTKLSKLQKDLEKQEELVKNAGVSEDIADLLTRANKKAVKDAKDAVTEAEKRIKTATETIDENKEKYDAIMAKIQKIEANGIEAHLG